ncbi:MAG: hypothetical protein OK455_06165, partial [Thaumarchaeota archaeon]|nr:hypothetical protein [Nitrososphaerota archaeon]
MTLRNAVFETFAILAILFLLGFGFVAYAFSPALDRASLESNGSPTGETAAAIGNSLSYSLVPLPVYLHQTPRSNYSFKEGGALIVISGDVLRVTTSFIGSANTAFSVVLQTGDRNLTLGSVKSTSSGSGLFKGNTTLASGTYHVGLLIFISGKTSGLVIPALLAALIGAHLAMI